MKRFLKQVVLYTFIILLLGYGIIYLSIAIKPGKMLGNSTEYALWMYKKKLIDMPYPTSKNVIIGDSRSMTGFNPAIIGHNFINLSLSGTTAFEGFITLKQFIQHHQIDTLIVSYGIFHFVESDVLEKWTLPYTLPSMADLNSLERVERQHQRTLDNQKPGYWLYFNRKATYFHLPIQLRSTFVENLKQNDYNATVIQQLEEFQGFTNVSVKDSSNALDTEVEIARKSDKFVTNPIITSYLDSIYSLSVKKRIQIIFLVPPINTASYSVLKNSHFLKQYLQFKENLKIKYPLMILDQKNLYLPNYYFHDGGHLNKRGVKFFSTYIKEAMETYWGSKQESDGLKRYQSRYF
jgi:hypothetical protein